MYQDELSYALHEIEADRGLSVECQLAKLDPILALGAKLDYLRLWKCLHTRQTFEYYFGRLEPCQRHTTNVLAYIFARESPDAIKWFVQHYKLDVTKRDRANIPFVYHVLGRDMEIIAEVVTHFKEEIIPLKCSVLEYVIEQGLFVQNKQLVRFLIYNFHAQPSEQLTYKLANKIMERNLKFEDYLALFIPLST